jgi:superfamily I DNA/RNA helicase
LSERQREAIENVAGPCRIVAGAGTGKTKTIINRVHHLVKTLGVHPSEVVAITYTNKAAGEMRQRFAGMVGIPAEKAARMMYFGEFPTICTFHSLCMDIIREEYERCGYLKAPSVYDDTDQLRLIKV